MSIGALVFMLGAWAIVLGLTFWSFWKVLRLPPARGDEPQLPEQRGGGARRA